MIACLVIAFGSLVYDSTLALPDYLIFAAFLLVGAGGLVWRVWKRPSTRTEKFEEPNHPGI